MTRRRRAVLLAGLALLLGGLAASDVSGREAALQRRLGRSVAVVVTRAPVAAGARLGLKQLAVRQVPERYAPAGAYSSARDAAGLRAGIALPAGTDVSPSLIDDGESASAAPGVPVRPGERVAELVARGSPQLIAPGARVDVLVTTETSDGAGETTLALQDAEVLAVTGAPAASGAGDHDDGGPRVALSLRVTLRQAVFLAAAQSFARELRVLPRAPGDRRQAPAGLRVGSGL